MTFKEAQELKKRLPVSYERNGFVFKILITPLDAADFTEFEREYRIRELTDEDAVLFSKNQTFKIRGLYADGQNVSVDRNPLKFLNIN